MGAADVELIANIATILTFVGAVIVLVFRFLWPNSQFVHSRLYVFLRRNLRYLVLAVVFYVIGYFVAALARQSTGDGDQRLVVQTVEVTRLVASSGETSPMSAIEVTREVPVEVTRLIKGTPDIVTAPPIVVTATPAPTQHVRWQSIVVDAEAQPNVDGFHVSVIKVEPASDATMRWSVAFWNQTNKDVRLRLDLDGCAYVADRDDGTRYAFERSNFRSGDNVVIQPQTRLDLWFEFADAVSAGARKMMIGLCPNFYAGVYFEPFNVDFAP